MSSTAPVVKRWRRFGHDRLYVTRVDGGEIGWADLQTGQMCAASMQQLPALTEAVATWKARTNWESRLAVPFAPASPAIGSTTSAGEGFGPSASALRQQLVNAVSPDLAAGSPVSRDAVARTDLRANVAGAEARKQALLLRDAAPVRTFFARLFNRRTTERAWRIGADGEEMVAAELTELCRWDPRWRVLHAIQVGTKGADIDHLVVGPGGVFTLNAKHHPGARIWVGGDTVLVNRTRVEYVRKSRYEAGRAARLLTAASGFPVRVHGVIVPVREQVVTIATPPFDVSVVPHKRIVPWLIERGGVLDYPSLHWISEVARKSSTWRPLEPLAPR